MVAFNNNFNNLQRYKTPDDQPPPEEILDWCRNAMAMIHDGGVWGIPRSGTIFQVDHTNKKLVLIMPGDDDEADFIATQHVFKYIGWSVVKK